MRPRGERMSGVSRCRALPDVSQFLARCLSAWYSQGRWCSWRPRGCRDAERGRARFDSMVTAWRAFLGRSRNYRWRKRYVRRTPRRDLRRLRHWLLRFKLGFGLFFSLLRALCRPTTDPGRPLGVWVSERPRYPRHNTLFNRVSDQTCLLIPSLSSCYLSFAVQFVYSLIYFSFPLQPSNLTTI